MRVSIPEPSDGWRLLSEEYQAASAAGDYSQMWDVLCAQARYRMQEGAFEDALRLLLQVFFWSINGIPQNKHRIENAIEMARLEGLYLIPAGIVHGQTVANIRQCCAEVGLTEEQLEGRIFAEYRPDRLPFAFLSAYQVIRACRVALSGKPEEAEEYVEGLGRKYVRELYRKEMAPA